MSISERIELIMSREKLTTDTLAGWLGISRARVSQKISGKIWDSLNEVMIISDKTGYSFNWICQGLGPEQESEAIEALENFKHIGPSQVAERTQPNI